MSFDTLQNDSSVRIGAVLVREKYAAQVRKDLPCSVSVATSFDGVPASVGRIIETAGHGAVSEFGAAALQSGRDLAIVSSGALHDDELRRQLTESARTAGRRVVVLSGAIGGVDALAAATVSGVRSVHYIGIKPPLAWLGTPAEKNTDLHSLASRSIIFSGSARDVARSFPKNANVAATIALAGIGFDKTTATFIADPAAKQNMHIIEVQSEVAEFSFQITAFPFAKNPKTSAIAANSVVAFLRSGAASIQLQ